MLYAGAGAARTATGATEVIPAAPAMIDAAPARANPLRRKTLVAMRIVSPSLMELNAAGQQIARQRVAVAQFDAVEGWRCRRSGLLNDQERNRQAVAHAQPIYRQRSQRVIELD